jgi:2-methylisocitrate lyase-like PEP mutase family enzyme
MGFAGFMGDDIEEEQNREREAYNLLRLHERLQRINAAKDEAPRPGEDTLVWMRRTGRME